MTTPRANTRDILEIMWQRHSSRGPFDPSVGIPESVLRQILDAARWAPTAHNMQNYEVIAVDDPHVLAQISAIRLQPAETFVHAPRGQLSISEAELAHTRIGLLPGMFPESWQEIDEEPAGAAASHSYLARTIQPCPLMLFVIYDSRLPADPADHLGAMSLGCVMQNIWLMSESHGIGVQVLSAFSLEAEEAKARLILAIPARLKIAFAVRLGYPLALEGSHLRVRRRIQDFLHRNRFGNDGTTDARLPKHRL